MINWKSHFFVLSPNLTLWDVKEPLGMQKTLTVTIPSVGITLDSYCQVRGHLLSVTCTFKERQSDCNICKFCKTEQVAHCRQSVGEISVTVCGCGSFGGHPGFDVLLTIN